ncbi:MAG: N-acetylglucosamine-6-phosphate deacetylase [Candidatus Poribacteria bacterium]|nr:N-acetylglucosamine-6-phosphate deacetylase [Candidatus Poribacteria bacterium]
MRRIGGYSPPMPHTIRLINATLYTPEHTAATEITFRDGRIVAIGERPDIEADATYDAQNAIVTPGLIDSLVHGGGGAATMDASHDSVYRIAESHARFGTTAICCGLSAAPMDYLTKVVDAIGEVAQNPSDTGSRVLGVYVEGKFGTPSKRGAHAKEHLGKPTVEAFKTLWKASRETIRIFSYAIEEDGGLELTRHLAERQDEYRNVVPTMGHTNADYDLACRAIDAGIRRATHTLNAMTPMHHRNLGVAEATLDDPRVFAEIIGDGLHVHPTWARLIMRLKGSGNAALITDALFAAALSSDQVSTTFERDEASSSLVTREGRRVFLRDGALFLPDGTLAGSRITLNDAVRNAVAWGASVEDAVRLSTQSPARNLSLSRKGELRPGYDADIAVFDADWNPLAVFVEGREIVNCLPRLS